MEGQMFRLITILLVCIFSTQVFADKCIKKVVLRKDLAKYLLNYSVTHDKFVYPEGGVQLNFDKVGSFAPELAGKNFDFSDKKAMEARYEPECAYVIVEALLRKYVQDNECKIPSCYILPESSFTIYNTIPRGYTYVFLKDRRSENYRSNSYKVDRCELPSSSAITGLLRAVILEDPDRQDKGEYTGNLYFAEYDATVKYPVKEGLTLKVTKPNAPYSNDIYTLEVPAKDNNGKDIKINYNLDNYGAGIWTSVINPNDKYSISYNKTINEFTINVGGSRIGTFVTGEFILAFKDKKSLATKEPKVMFEYTACTK